MTMLFEPLKIKDVQLRNKIGVSPMCQYSYQDGQANDWLLTHLGARAVGGAGLVITEATAVEAKGRISPFDLGIWKDSHIAGLKQVVDFIHAQGAVAGIQIAHAGRKACTRPPFEGGTPYQQDHDLFWEAVGPSAIAFSDDYQTPMELTNEEILKIEDAFRMAASRALEAGFKWLEIHAAHGYLIHSFLSPLSNHRTDKYGGVFENRIRFLLEIIKKVKSVWKETYPLTVRISGTDWFEAGWSVEDSIKLSKILSESGVDLIDCSSGGIIPGVKIPVEPGYQVPISEKVRKQAGVRTATVGWITEAEQAEKILQNQQADLILLGREFLRNPYWPYQAAKILQADFPAVKQYERAF